MTIDELSALMERQEPMHPDLQVWVQKLPNKMLLLNSPLVQELMFDPSRCALINARYEQKQRQIKEALTANDAHRYIWLHERPYRIMALVAATAQIKMSDAEYWQFVGATWEDSENIWQNKKTWRGLWNAKRPDKIAAMDEDEQHVLTNLPNTIIVFRGIGTTRKADRKGYAWTLDHAKAKWFAKRYQSGGGAVLHGEVPKQYVHALLLGRNEQEIVSNKVKIIKEEAV